jgi:hypothetical protein
MRQKANSDAQSSEQIVKGIRRATRKRYSAEEKIRNRTMEEAGELGFGCVSDTTPISRSGGGS